MVKAIAGSGPDLKYQLYHKSCRVHARPIAALLGRTADMACSLLVLPGMASHDSRCSGFELWLVIALFRFCVAAVLMSKNALDHLCC